MRNFLLVFPLLLTPSAFANCEAGGYSIHTVANYGHPGEESRELMVYKIDKNQLKASRGALVKHETLAHLIGKKARAKLGKETCELAKGWSLDPAFKPDDAYSAENPYWLSLAHCPALAKALPTSGYLIVDTKSGDVTLPASLPIRKAKPEAFAEEKKTASAEGRSRKLHLMNYPIWDSPGKSEESFPLTAGLIRGDESTVTEIGSETRPFLLVLNTLRLSGVKKKYPGFYKMTSKTSDELFYPLIFFRHPKTDKLQFIGDGSACAWNVGESKKSGFESGTFAPTHAFDFDSDGTVDLLEVNHRFAYWLDGQGKPTVLTYGQGC